MFQALTCSSSGGLRRNCIYAASGVLCPVHRLRKKFFLNRCTRQSPAESDDTRDRIYTITKVDLLKMSSVMLETCRGF